MFYYPFKNLLAVCLLSGFFASGSYAKNIKAFMQSPASVKSSAANKNHLVLSTGSFDPIKHQLSFADTNIHNNASNKYGIVQFHNKKSDFQWLLDNGFKVIQNIPNNAYLVNWNNADKTLLDTNTNIRWYGNFQSGYKVSPKLWAGNRINHSSFQIAIRTFHDVEGFNLNHLIKKHFPSTKIVKTNDPSGYHHYVIEVEARNINAVLNKLSATEDIQWLGPYQAQKFYNNEAVSATQATSGPVATPIFDEGIYGTGQIIGVADSGLDRNEDWFTHLDKGAGIVNAITDAEDVTPPTLGTLYPNNKVIAYWVMPGAEAYDSSDEGFHGTHVSGSLAGDRQQVLGAESSASVSSPTSSGYDNDDGMAPNAQILFQDLDNNNSPNVLTGSGSSPMWEQAYAAGAAIHSNSYGASFNGEYTGSDRQVDTTLRELEDMIILFSAGNSGSASNTIGSPGSAKNVTTVGALGHGNSTGIAGFSSRGPTDDGRLKPDIVATGTGIQSARGDTNNTSVDAFPLNSSKQGTSMSTPITAGSTALLRQYFMDGFYPTGAKNALDSITPSGTLMKAVLLNGTKTDAGFFNNNVGWGRVWLENSLYFTGESKKLRIWEFTNTNGLETGEQFSVDLEVQAGVEFRATLVWYDLEGPVGSGITLVNNLDLTVDIAADSYKANNFSGDNSTSSGTSDSINTVEQVRFSAPVTGTYTITVDATSIPGNGSFDSDKQGFALVVSGDLSSGGIPSASTGPSGLTAISNGLAGINLDWTAATGDYDNYEIYRVNGSCITADLTKVRYIGNSMTNSYVDNSTSGGSQYAYKVRAFSDDLISEYTNCIDIISQQICDIVPSFDASSVVVSSSQASLCQVSLAWDAASSNCPAATDIQYNIYRSTSHNFVPNNTNLIATSLINATSFTDFTTLSGQPYFYVVKAEDTTSNGTGPNNGNQTLTIKEMVATSLGSTVIEGDIVDDVDNLALMKLNSIWSVSSNQSSNGALSYRSALEGSSVYESNTCARMYSPTFDIPLTPSNTPSISYQARYDLEDNWDGVVVEISINGGAWIDLPPDGGYPSDFSQTMDPPINVCGYTLTQGAFSGDTTGLFDSITHNLSAYQGQSIKIRWSLSSDPGTEEEGFYLDEVQYSNIQAPQACLAEGEIFKNGFED